MTDPRRRSFPAKEDRDKARDERELQARARALRREASDAERLLWTHLRSRRMLGRKFRRQAVIGPYIVDFFCLEAGLVIEADGGQHAERTDYDARRTGFLEARGYRVIRFWNNEILGQLDVVLDRIRLALLE